MKYLGVLLLHPGWDACPSQGYPPSSMLPVPIYTPGWRETKWSKVPCLWKQRDGRGLNPGPPDLECEVLHSKPWGKSSFPHFNTSPVNNRKPHNLTALTLWRSKQKQRSVYPGERRGFIIHFSTWFTNQFNYFLQVFLRWIYMMCFTEMADLKFFLLTNILQWENFVSVTLNMSGRSNFLLSNMVFSRGWGILNLTYNNNCENFWEVLLFCFIPTLKREDLEIVTSKRRNLNPLFWTTATYV